ncbi:ParA family protein [Mycoplasma capricolum]|uniref:AAA domain-containing protein n=1 Tax=Mycoplasma capricolum subsp. capricolum (strain California kid / ATCC 27343 / NCTC 10154) TaxID=340047 RepID=Q2SSJ5_MYCCT|nr:ParA family protein [Mycoplasma capricolum]ABC01293.1 hypothetical protein MCAP_0282 [Mycoplasma capricolum subsp. capricolum ATCC 27343]
MKNYKKILIHNTKGGVGKTLITANIAAYLANQNKKVLLIDFDKQRSLTSYFTNSEKEESWKIFTDNQVPEIIQSNVHPNIWIIPGDSKLEPQIDFLVMELYFRNFEDKNFNDFDYIFLDLSPYQTNVTTISYKNVDSLILLTDPSLNSVEILSKAVLSWENTFEKIHLKNTIKAVIINKYTLNDQPKRAWDELQKSVNKYLLKTKIPNQANIAKSVLVGEKWMYEQNSSKEIFKDLIEELKQKGAI